MKKICYIILICALLLVCLNAWGCNSEPAGLYNASGECLFTWEELINNYGLNFEGYSSQSSDEEPVTMYDLLEEYPELKEGTKLIMSDNMRRIGKSACEEWEQLTYIEIGKNVTIIDDYAFCVCSSLRYIDIPDKVTIIGDWAFSDCDSLESVILPDGLESIGEGAFAACPFKSVILPNGLESIGKDAFAFGALTSIVIPSSVTTISENAFEYNNKNMVIFCEATRKPVGWDSNWARKSWSDKSGYTVYWGDEWHYVDGVPTPK